MTTKEELKAKKRHRYMLQGPVGSGKSYTLALLAKRYSEQGKRVFFIDFRDIGATAELLKIDEKTLANITYETPQNYTDLQNLKFPDNVGLIVFDAMHHLRTQARNYIIAHYIQQGHYTIKGKETKIEDMDTFDLGTLGGYGTGYGAANLREGEIIDKILNAPCDIAISAIPDKPKEDSDTFTDILKAYFANIITLSFRDSDEGKRVWFYKLYRWRGIETNDYSEQENKGDIDPFAIIEKTGGKPVREYMVRFKLDGESKKEFIMATDAEEAEVVLQAKYEIAKEIEVIE
jgi:energy-coupling factor transporter ATP-binding protein EcfA2